MYKYKYVVHPLKYGITHYIRDQQRLIVPTEIECKFSHTHAHCLQIPVSSVSIELAYVL